MSSSNRPTPATTANEVYDTIGVPAAVSAQLASSALADGTSTAPASGSNVLLDADKVVSVERWEEHGDPCANLDRIAAMWAATFGWVVTGEDVALAMILFKVCRATAGDTRDNLVDIAGYARTIEMLWERRKNPQSSSD